MERKQEREREREREIMEPWNKRACTSAFVWFTDPIIVCTDRIFAIWGIQCIISTVR